MRALNPAGAKCEPHTPSPAGYLDRQAWAEKMSKTHKQRQCSGCGLWAIWEPLPPMEPLPRMVRPAPLIPPPVIDPDPARRWR